MTRPTERPAHREPSTPARSVADPSRLKGTSAQLAEEAARSIAQQTGAERHDIALVLGSGWGGAAERIGETIASVDQASIPGFTASAVAGHSSQLRSVRIGDSERRALVFGTRTHAYEGRGVDAVVHAVRTAAAAGCQTLVLTNGCGSIRPEWKPGTAVLIRDHINLTGLTPLTGATFVDLTEVYSQRLRGIAHEVDPELPEGVYVQFHGPQYETPAEVRMAGILGGDLVGMSTTLEAVAARQVGLEVLGLSLVTNLAAGIGSQILDHSEVIAEGKAAAERLAGLLSAIVTRI